MNVAYDSDTIDVFEGDELLFVRLLGFALDSRQKRLPEVASGTHSAVTNQLLMSDGEVRVIS